MKYIETILEIVLWVSIWNIIEIGMSKITHDKNIRLVIYVTVMTIILNIRR
jgi:hypothetical protein